MSPFGYGLAVVLMLALGAGWFMLHRTPASPAPEPARAAPVKPPSLPPLVENATLEQAEEYFETWGGYVVWENDAGEFALWSPAAHDYTQFFEVRRSNGQFTFRRLAKLTRPLIDHGVRAATAMAFTETQAMRELFLRQNPGFTPRKPSQDDNAAAPDLPPRPPERFASARQPTQTGTAADPATTERALLAALNAALVRAGEKSAAIYNADLLAVLQLNRAPPLAASASVTEIDAALSRRKDAIEGILAASTAYLSPAQLRVFRTVLDGEIHDLQMRRTQAAGR
jgi:hypothetical protein